MEREGHIIACAALFPFFKDKCGEVAAIAVSPECRGQGQGDKLLGMTTIILFILSNSILYLSYIVCTAIFRCLIYFIVDLDLC